MASYTSLKSDCPSSEIGTPETVFRHRQLVDASTALSIPGDLANLNPDRASSNGSRGRPEFRSLPNETNVFREYLTDPNDYRRDPVKKCPCVEDGASPLNKKCSDDCIRLTIFEFQDRVRWYPPETVVIVKEAGKLGFSYKPSECKGEKYTLVKTVNPGGPADRKLAMGDHILSANGTPLNNNKTLTEIIEQSTDTMRFIRCRPQGILPLRKQVYRRSPSAPNPDVQAPGEVEGSRRTSGDSADKFNSQLTSNGGVKRSDSNRSKGSGNSHSSQQYAGESGDNIININISMPSPTEEHNNVFPIGLNENNQGDAVIRTKELDSKLIDNQYRMIEAHIDKTLSSDMPRLPDLKLIIIGSESNNIAKSLLQRRQLAPALRHDIYMQYKCQVTRENDWTPEVIGDQGSLRHIVKAVHQSYGESILVVKHKLTQYSKLLQQVCLDTSEPDSPDFVDLEILAMSDSQQAMYCGHIQYTAHSVYIVQFSITNFMKDQKSVLTYIQKQLIKIRTYASDMVQVLLVATSMSNDLTRNTMTLIGQSLHDAFSKAYGNQIDYNPESNLPCYFLISSEETSSHQTNDLSRVPYHKQVSCEDNTKEAHDTVDDITHGHNGINDITICNCQTDHSPGAVWQTDGLKSRITNLVLQQPFVSCRYPFQFLIYRDQIKKFRDNQHIGTQKSDIMRECKVNDEEGNKALLKYLHNCGDIICMDQLQYMMSQHLLNSRLSFMVLLSRDHLINAACKLTVIPSLANQNPQSRTHWKTLQDTAQLSHWFLHHLLSQDAGVLCIFLDMMNVIFCMDDGMHLEKFNPAPRYLVPYYLPRRHLDEEAESMQSRLPQHFDPYVLYMDFLGFIPHGTFISILLQLIGLAKKTNGNWCIDSQLSGHVSFGNDCQLQLLCDDLEARIKICAECNITYHPWNIFAVLSERMKNLKPCQGDMRYKCGPPCPLCLPDQVIHVLDIRGGRGPLWCGNQSVDQDPSVRQWLMEEPREPSAIDCETHRQHIQTTNHIRVLPLSLYKWICNHLNVTFTSGQDWKMLADLLGYHISEIRIFEAQHRTPEDPCDSLLQSWGRQDMSATLGKLCDHLFQMERHDLLTDMKHKWSIIQ